MAQQPLPQYFRKPYQDLSGGLCSRPDPQLVPANKFVQLDNAILADHDILEKAPGYTIDGSPFPNNPDSWIRMLINYRIGSGTNSLVVAAQDNGNANASYKVDFKQTFGNGTYNYIGYTVGTATFSGTAVTGTSTFWLTNLKPGDKIGSGAQPTTFYEIQSVLSDTSLTLTTSSAGGSGAYMARIILNFNFLPIGLVFNNKLVITNGSEEMMEFDDTTITRITGFKTAFGIQSPLFLEKYKNRLFAADRTTLYWSKVNDETAWNAASLEPIFPEDNGNIVQIKSFANSILVFKDNGLIYQVRGEFDQDVVGAPTSIILMIVPDNLGIIAGKTVVINDDGQLYFTCETGVYTVDQWYLQFKKISWDIQPDIQKLIFKSASTTSKQFTFASSAQWNTGTLSGTKVDNSNRLTTYNDRLSITGAVQGDNLASEAMDSSNNTHIAYLASINNQTITYSKLSASGIQITEYAVPGPATPPVGYTLANRALSIACAANGDVGIGYITIRTGGTETNGRSIRLNYVARTIIGTATFVAGSNAVVGQGTAWLTGAQPLSTGSIIKNAIDSTFATVSTVNSDTSITLTAGYAGTASSVAAYVAWSTPFEVDNLVFSNSTNSDSAVLDIKFSPSSNDPSMLYAGRSDTGAVRDVANFYVRSGGIFTKTNFFAANVLSLTETFRCSLVASGANIYSDFVLDEHIGSPSHAIQCYTSTNGGASFTLLERFVTSMVSTDGIQLAVNGGGNSITGYGESGNIKTRNHSTATTVTIDATANSYFNGYDFYSGNNYAMNVVGIAPNQFEKYIFLGTSTVSDTTPNLLLQTYRTSDQLSNNGPVFSSIAFGINVGEIVVRRISFVGTWTSAETSDPTLSSWGTYAVSGESDNGNTVLQQIALGTTPVLGPFNTITNGTIISTNNSNIYWQVKVTMTIATLTAPVIASIVLNYFGQGLDAKAPWAFVFNNEIYMSATQTGNTANNVIMFLDRKYAWGEWFPPVTEFARMNQTLYAGSSLRGDVYKLKQGLNFAGSAYTMTAITKEDMMGSLELTKDISKVYVLYRAQAAGTFTFSYRLNNYSTVGGTAWTDVPVEQTSGNIFEIPIQQTASSIQFKITQGDADVQIGFIGFILLYAYLNLR